MRPRFSNSQSNYDATLVKLTVTSHRAIFSRIEVYGAMAASQFDTSGAAVFSPLSYASSADRASHRYQGQSVAVPFSPACTIKCIPFMMCMFRGNNRNCEIITNVCGQMVLLRNLERNHDQPINL